MSGCLKSMLQWMLKLLAGVSAADLKPSPTWTGRRMTMTTDLPGVQVYSGNFLEEKHSGICFETQIPPDAIHHDNFPNCILMPDQEFESETVYRFDVAEDEFWA